jgi:hypothetical protein
MDREKICTTWGDAAYTVEYTLVVPGAWPGACLGDVRHHPGAAKRARDEKKETIIGVRRVGRRGGRHG